jgi:two-component system response regulator HydG
MSSLMGTPSTCWIVNPITPVSRSPVSEPWRLVPRWSSTGLRFLDLHSAFRDDQRLAVLFLRQSVKSPLKPICQKLKTISISCLFTLNSVSSCGASGAIRGEHLKVTARKRKILVVDAGTRASLGVLLRSWGFEVLQAGDAGEAKRLLERHEPDIVITDVLVLETSDLDLLPTLKTGNPHRPVFLITAQGSIDRAVEAVKQGARDFLLEPLDLPRLRALLDDAEREVELRRKAKRLSDVVDNHAGCGEVVGTSRAIREVFQLIERVAQRDVSVMITDESGTSKADVARLIHKMSRRKDKPFLAVNAGAIPESVIESDILGHERGAFAGAVATKQGVFEQANGGTLLIDEINEIPISLQKRLLRALADGKVQRLGGIYEFEFDVRVLAGTNEDPLKAVDEGKLRPDLYYRLNVVPIAIPPLRERGEDVPFLAQHFIKEFNSKHQLTMEGITDEALALLKAYPWPGNVRELQNVIERAVVLAKGEWIDERDLPPYVRDPARSDEKLIFAVGETTIADAERELVLKTLARAGNNKAEAARQLGIDVKTIYNKLKSYGVEA